MNINILSCSEILSVIEIGDSLTDIWRKCKLSYVTVQKSILLLESKKIITSNEVLTKHGKAKICTDFNLELKEAGTKLFSDYKILEEKIL